MQVVPQKTVINGEYYLTNIFAKGYLDAINRKAQNGGGFQRSLKADTSQVVFVQDRAPPFTAQKSQHWCRENLPGFWGRAAWPENSPDLYSTENIWLIPQDKANKMAPTTTADELVKQLKRV